MSNVLIIGAGPASLYAAGKLAKEGCEVFIVNRDIKPGGLAEFGIYPNKYKMKRGLRKVFRRILARDNVHYYGNVTVGEEGAVDLEDLRSLGFDAVIVAVGAQGTKWLGLPGEEAEAAFHAKDLVYHYNALPPYSEREFAVGQRVCVVGLGNVCLDIVHWLVCEKKIEEVTSVYRRGPAERATTPKEMKLVSGALDRAQLAEEKARIARDLEAVGQDPDEVFASLTAYQEEPLEVESPTRFRMRFLRSPSRVEVDDGGQVAGLTCEITRLVDRGGSRPAVEGTGRLETIPCDTVIFAIGDAIEPGIGLPLDPRWGATFATVPEPWPEHPDRPRYMVLDVEAGRPMWGVFVVGWARVASDGLVGKAKADAEVGCDEVLAWIGGTLYPEQPARATSQPPEALRGRLEALLAERGVRAVGYAGVERLLELEAEEARRRELPEYKFANLREMLSLLDL